MKNLTVLIPLILLAACSKPSEQTHTVSEYFKNTELMNAKVKLCHDNYGSIGETPDCQNAVKAHRQYGDMRGGCDVAVQMHKATFEQCADNYFKKWVKP